METEQLKSEVCDHPFEKEHVIEKPFFSIDGVMLGSDIIVYCGDCGTRK